MSKRVLCVHCNKAPARHTCGGCIARGVYCTKACQKADWSRHQSLCGVNLDPLNRRVIEEHPNINSSTRAHGVTRTGVVGRGVYGRADAVCIDDTGCEYILKVIPLSNVETQQDDEDAIHEFIKEAKLSVRMGEARVAPLVMDAWMARIVGRDKDDVDRGLIGYIVMERYEMTLGQLMDKLGPSQWNALMRDGRTFDMWARVFTKTHDYGVIHHDAHPGNVMVRWDDHRKQISRLVLIDWGLSFVRGKPYDMQNLLLFVQNFHRNLRILTRGTNVTSDRNYYMGGARAEAMRLTSQRGKPYDLAEWYVLYEWYQRDQRRFDLGYLNVFDEDAIRAWYRKNELTPPLDLDDVFAVEPPIFSRKQDRDAASEEGWVRAIGTYLWKKIVG